MNDIPGMCTKMRLLNMDSSTSYLYLNDNESLYILKTLLDNTVFSQLLQSKIECEGLILDENIKDEAAYRLLQNLSS